MNNELIKHTQKNKLQIIKTLFLNILNFLVINMKIKNPRAETDNIKSLEVYIKVNAKAKKNHRKLENYSIYEI